MLHVVLLLASLAHVRTVLAGEFPMRRREPRKMLRPAPLPSRPAPIVPPASPAPPAANQPPRATLLVLGDSLVGGPFAFARALREQLQSSRVRVVQDTWVGVGIGKFARDRRLGELLGQHKPTHVFIVLGTNDYRAPYPDRLAGPTERIVAKVSAALAPPGTTEPSGPVQCAWIGPVVPKDTGVVAMLSVHTSPCAFVDSRRFGVATIKDGFHPTLGGSRVWAQGVIDLLTIQGWALRAEPVPEETP